MSKALKVENGTTYIFNSQMFKLHFNKVSQMHGKKQEYTQKIADKTCKSCETVRGWLKNNDTGPSDLDTVKELETFFDVPAGTFLMPKSSANIHQEESVMREILDHERNVARKIYADMCDMIHQAEFMDDELTHILHGSTISKSTISGRTDNEYKREQLILSVRKYGFDIPATVRDKVIDLINEAFGPWNIDDYDRYFRADEYKMFLQKNGLEDNNGTRYYYSDLFISRLYQKLDDIFSIYRR